MADHGVLASPVYDLSTNEPLGIADVRSITSALLSGVEQFGQEHISKLGAARITTLLTTPICVMSGSSCFVSNVAENDPRTRFCAVCSTARAS